MKVNYTPSGICPEKIEIEIEDCVVKNVNFIGGCSGNLQGISKLVKGMKVDDVFEQFEGIRCGNKSTSCPNQLAKALKRVKEMEEKRRGTDESET